MKHQDHMRRAGMGPDHPEECGLQSIFDAANDFGLNDKEVLRAADEALHGADTVSEYREELNAALARSILSKQREALSQELS